MIRRLAFFSLLAILLLAACSPSSQAVPEMSRSSAPGPAAAPAMESQGYAADKAAQSGGNMTVESVTSASSDRLVIRNASLSIVVVDPSKAMDTITKLATDYGGFVVTSNLYKTQTSSGVEVPVADITIRVPAERLNEALTQVKSLVEDPKLDILSENVSGQDVTKEYTDLNSRLTNLLATEKQLQKFLDQAVKTEDVLAVYNQLVQIRDQIEVIKGQIKYYEESAALSAISVNLQSKAAVEPLTIGGWQPIGVARDALQALINALRGIANAAIWLILFLLPVLLVLLLPVWVVFILIRRWVRKSRKAAPRPPAPPTP